MGLVYDDATTFNFSLRKLKAGVAFGLIVAALSLIGIVETPAWVWLGAGVVASWLPDFELQLLLERRRNAIIRQIPPVADHLCLGLSAGLALEQALHEVIDEAGDVELARELNLVIRARGQTLDEALLALVERNRTGSRAAGDGAAQWLRSERARGRPAGRAGTG